MRKIDLQQERRGPFHNTFLDKLHENMEDNFTVVRGHEYTGITLTGIWSDLTNFRAYFFNSLWFLRRQTFGMDLSGSEWIE